MIEKRGVVRFVFISNNAVVIVLLLPLYHVSRKRFMFADVHWKKKSWISSNRINGSVLKYMKNIKTLPVAPSKWVFPFESCLGESCFCQQKLGQTEPIPCETRGWNWFAWVPVPAYQNCEVDREWTIGVAGQSFADFILWEYSLVWEREREKSISSLSVSQDQAAFQLPF